MKVLVTGGTGFVGKALVKELLQRNMQVIVVSRDAKVAEDKEGLSYIGLPLRGALLPPEALNGVQAIVNLAGESIGGRRWNQAVRQRILQSRVSITRCLVESMQRNQEQGISYPRIFISASAIGYYGTDAVRLFTEDSKPGHDFLARVCQQWETEAVQADLLGARVVRLRLGHVLDKDGGMLPRVALPFKLGVGGYLGDGLQWMSWIHRQDVLAVILRALQEESWQGEYNLCAPTPVTMKEFMAVLGETLGSKSRTHVPAVAAKLLFGEMAEEVLLKGQKVYPQRLLQEGYSFLYTHLPEALRAIYSQKGD